MHSFEGKRELSLFLKTKKDTASTGFVPTMGALHAGHISLIETAKRENNFVVCSIFVNPTQFNDKKDLEKYPRTLELDLEKLREANCDVVFIPSVAEMYPEEETPFELSFGALEEVMEGRFRPGHFKGVAMIVDKLFQAVHPDNAYFGEKDFQQLAVVTELSKRKHKNIRIVPCPTKRETDGLAMSSRNTLLSKEERKIAPVIYQTLSMVKDKRGKILPEELKQWAFEHLAMNKLIQPEYFEIVDSLTLQAVSVWSAEKKIRACVAVKLGNVRLIDNMEI